MTAAGRLMTASRLGSAIEPMTLANMRAPRCDFRIGSDSARQFEDVAAGSARKADADARLGMTVYL
jgi:hypothetical protein